VGGIAFTTSDAALIKKLFKFSAISLGFVISSPLIISDPISVVLIEFWFTASLM
jgi:hypothetical protein